MSTYRIALMPGDGIGPEVIREAVKIGTTILETLSVSVFFEEFPNGAEHYIKTGETLSDETIEKLRGFDAIFFGAVGDPRIKPGVLEKGILLKLRSSLDLYVNLRPVKLLRGVETPLKGFGPGDIDFVVIRENTEDFYVDMGGRVDAFYPKVFEFTVKTGGAKGSKYRVEVESKDSEAFQIGIISRKGAERIIRFSFEYAFKRGMRKITFVDKANVLTDTYGLWREIVDKVKDEYKDRVESEFMYVDAAALHMVLNPKRFQVIVAPNMFGDILTDLGAAIQGGLGFAPSGNINPEGTSMFEPVHGSAPDKAGRNIANPIASILTFSLMLEHLWSRYGDKRLLEASKIIEKAVENVLADGRFKTIDMGGNTKTNEMGDAILSEAKRLVYSGK
ncbi:MAG: isocitrate/isopropylmalate dehydrogenase family protein [Crenarchaeota archaeon]|nr:isocitrate/isopropylmalate dehydrogenase family protein [Thermoproteota archaeon]MDW8034347.1 isocitrate/isopropylmalate dehydrogenase family protein [Nitrososphaerota archaeon]